MVHIEILGNHNKKTKQISSCHGYIYNILKGKSIFKNYMYFSVSNAISKYGVGIGTTMHER